MIEMNQWRHVFKLDQNKSINDEDLERICQSGTDAIMIGGTDGVTFDNTVDLLSRVRRYALPCVLEVSHIETIVPGFDLYFIPLALNAGTTDWIFDPHVEGLKEYGPFVPWDEVITEGYVVLNEDSQVAQVTKSRTDVTLDDVKAYARLADKLLQLPVLYLEYSGTYGQVAWVKEISGLLENSRLFYGGGIGSQEQAQEMARWADTVIVGNVIYEDMEAAIETVAGVKGVTKER